MRRLTGGGVGLLQATLGRSAKVLRGNRGAAGKERLQLRGAATSYLPNANERQLRRGKSEQEVAVRTGFNSPIRPSGRYWQCETEASAIPANEGPGTVLSAQPGAPIG